MLCMRALEISLNSKRLCLAGIGNKATSSTIVTCIDDGRDGLGLEIEGLIGPQEQVKWVSRQALGLGDVIQIRIVDTDQVDEPRVRHNAKDPAGRHIGGIIGPY
jgi:hypothetical protein